MNLSELLYTLLIGPLEELFEVVYFMAYKINGNPGFAIILLSLFMNFLLLPLYKRTDAIQDKAIETENKMKPYVDHIKKTFKGDERFMLIQTCYKQHNYKPTDALKGLTPLMLEIPFFIAAYNFLSNLSLLNGVSFGIINDLSSPDGLIMIGGLVINFLPILMTIINIISSAIYTKGASKQTKFQLYGMAALFMILLYDSPSGLVIYWTLNNLFSLIKNIITKLNNKKTFVVLKSTCFIIAIICLGYIWLGWHSIKVKMILTILLCLFCMPLIFKKNNISILKNIKVDKNDDISYFIASLIMTLLIGLLIPSSVINASPEEFINIGLGLNPNVFYIISTLCLAAGTFLIWFKIFYSLSNNSFKKMLIYFMWILCGASIIGYMFFGTNYGNMSSQFIYDKPINVNLKEGVFNLILILIVVAVILLILIKKKNMIITIGLAITIAMVGMSFSNINESQKLISAKLEQMVDYKVKDKDLFSLSKHGKNVVVIMLDRSVNSLVPYIFNEKPELFDQFSGFTYYPNTLSFGAHTNFGLPSVFGGYEYTPVELNKRNEELLVDKHNEALKVMPVIFEENDYKVTVCDPTYAGYTNIPDLSIYNDYPNINKYITMGRYNETTETLTGTVGERFFRYSIMRISPTFIHELIYDGGNYLQLNDSNGQTQIVDSHLIANGEDNAFSSSISVLKLLPQLTEITDDNSNTFMMMCNDTAHSPALLQLPDYEMKKHVDNSEFDSEVMVREDGEGGTINMPKIYQIEHYHANMAAYIQIGKWLDYLKENEVYDNTRIIIVSDHGFEMDLHGDWKIDYTNKEYSQDHSDIMFYNPILLVKDFDSKGEFDTDDTFMTNADTPSIAFRDLIENPINPFTHKEINNDAKSEPELFVTLSDIFKTNRNCGTTYRPDPWAAVSGNNIFDPNNWRIIQPEEIEKYIN